MHKLFSLFTGLTLFTSASYAVAADKPVLTIYTYDSFVSEWGPGPAIEKNFEATCNCDLQFVGLDSSLGILGRIQLEGASSKADIALGLEADYQKTLSRCPEHVEPAYDGLVIKA